MPKPDFAAEERFMQQHEERQRQTTARVIAVLEENGRSDLVAEFEKRLHDIDSGVDGARSTWHSISDAQRRILLLLSGGRRWLTRSPGSKHFYDAQGEPHALSRIGTLRGVRALAARGLLDWEGGALDPERKAVLSEKARFVLKHGKPGPGEVFAGYRP
ncbi:hypothetical protein [Methylorubrum suomiense]|uniref:MarR family transcriptional regulator n=1 Tax=Methylorubrum suomiense TaxID=144191 RepID=A0ABQ4UZN6_9HYPH|nr:hypothetical protein [Methylorubrum suomiense]GJE77305.1 hypothetical protein BGCPKDLD_3908 [Methylorubrum suomiense]